MKLANFVNASKSQWRTFSWVAAFLLEFENIG
jgi:hypothetical protein